MTFITMRIISKMLIESKAHLINFVAMTVIDKFKPILTKNFDFCPCVKTTQVQTVNKLGKLK